MIEKVEIGKGDVGPASDRPGGIMTLLGTDHVEAYAQVEGLLEAHGPRV